MEEFKERLAKAINKSGLTAAEISRKTGISESMISRYLSGQFKAKQDKLTYLADALGVTETYLLGYDDDDDSEPEDLTEVQALLEDLKNNPEKRMLFSLLADATIDDIKRAVAVIEALKNTNG